MSASYRPFSYHPELKPPTAPPVFPLSVSGSGRYLVDSQAAPFFINGESAWAFGQQLSLADVDYYLADRQARGVNAVLMQIVSTMQSSPPSAFGAVGTPAPFLTPGDLTTPNPAYFAHVKAVIDHCASYGVLSIAAPLYLGYPGTAQGWAGVIASASTGDCASYGAYLAATFGSCPNILWLASGDNYESPYYAKTNAIMQAIKAGSPGQLRTSHWQRHSLATDILAVNSSYDWANVNTVYTGFGSAYRASLGYAYSPTMPAFHVETPYADPLVYSLLEVRAENFLGWLGGATTGVISGRVKIFQFGSSFSEFGWQNTPWKPELGGPPDDFLLPLSQLVTGRAWHLLVPTPGLVTSGGGTITATDYIARAKTPDGTLAALYARDAQSGFTVDRSLMSSAFNATWFDPTSGATVSAGAGITNSGTQSFSRSTANAQGVHDYVLLLEVP